MARPSRRFEVPVGALVLIGLGVLLLLQTTGVISWSLWENLWRFWPVILIAIGASLLLGSRSPILALLIVVVLLVGAVALAAATSVSTVQYTASLSEPLGNVRSATVEINFGAGKLVVHSLPEGSINLIEGNLQSANRNGTSQIERSGDTAAIRLGIGGPRGFLFGRTDKSEWDVALSRLPMLTIEMNTGAADVNADLRGLKVAYLNLNVGAATVEVTLPDSAGSTGVQVNGGASNVTLIVPQGVAGRVHSSSGLSSVNVDTSRFPRTGDFYLSPHYDAAVNRVDIEVRAGASSVTIK